MKENKIRDLIDKLLTKKLVMHLSCSSKQEPWICALEFVHDEEFKLYWRSDESSHHSQIISNNEQTAIAITKVNDSNKGVGVQARGESEKVNNLTTINRLEKQISKKRNKQVSDEIEEQEDNRQWWVFKPDTIFYLNEELLGYERVELDLKD